MANVQLPLRRIALTALNNVYSIGGSQAVAPKPKSNVGLIVAIVFIFIIIIAVVIITVVVSQDSSSTSSSSSSTPGSSTSPSSSSPSSSGTTLADIAGAGDGSTTDYGDDVSSEYDTFVALSPAFACADCSGSNCQTYGESALDSACKSYYGSLSVGVQDSRGYWATNEPGGGTTNCVGFCETPLDNEGYVKNEGKLLTDVYACADCSVSDCSNNGEDQSKNHCKMIYGTNATSIDDDSNGWGTNKYAGGATNCSSFCSGQSIDPDTTSLADFSEY